VPIDESAAEAFNFSVRVTTLTGSGDTGQAPLTGHTVNSLSCRRSVAGIGHLGERETGRYWVVLTRPCARSSSPEFALDLTTSSIIYHNVMVMLGEFEYLLLTAAARLGDVAYGASIRQEIEAATRRNCSIGALYTTLDRLEAKGFIKTWMGDPTPQRGGRAKRMVRVTAKGIQASTAFYNAVTRVSRGVSWEAN
jgi:PadR family transcriptional regulator PadR